MELTELTDFDEDEQYLLVLAYAYEILGTALTTDALFDGAAYVYEDRGDKNIKGFQPYTGQWVQDYKDLPGLADAADDCAWVYNAREATALQLNLMPTDFKVLWKSDVIDVINGRL